MDTTATQHQSPPHGTGKKVLPLIVEDIQERFAPISATSNLLRDVRARVALGTQRYGEPLTAHNGRHAVTDAYQELLDAALYLRQWEAEGHYGFPDIYLLVLDLCHALREEFDAESPF